MNKVKTTTKEALIEAEAKIAEAKIAEADYKAAGIVGMAEAAGGMVILYERKYHKAEVAHSKGESNDSKI